MLSVTLPTSSRLFYGIASFWKVFMTHRRLWTEDCRERSLNSVVDVLEGYYRCRVPGGGRGPGYGDRGSDSGYSAFSYLDYLKKVGQAYATLPLRMLSQVYGSSPQPYQNRDCAPEQPDTLFVEPRKICIPIAGALAGRTRFKLQSNVGEEVNISFSGFKDASQAVVAIDLLVRDETSEWSNLSAPSAHPASFELDDCECRTIAVKVAAKPSPKGIFTGKLKVVGESGVVVRVKVVFDNT